MSRLYDYYITEGRATLQRSLGVAHVLAVPSLEKIVLNVGLGEALTHKKVIETAQQHISALCGQKPIIRYAKKDISSFKLRKGEAIGVQVTIRRKRMYDFLYKLVHVVFPRLRDFRGFPDSGFDGRGGYTLGIREQIVFPEIEYSAIDTIRGLEISFVTTARTHEATKSLLRLLGMPFQKESEHTATRPAR